MEAQRVFDAHAHLAPRPDSAERILTSMDRNGIDRTVVVAGAAISPDELSRQIIVGGHIEKDADNTAVLEGCAGAPGRLVPFFFANPHREAGEYRSRGTEFRGLKLAPGVHGVPLADERTQALVSAAAELGHNVYLHCLHREGFGVRDLVGLARRFPAVTFVLGHAGVGDLDLYGIDLITDSGNIVFETSGGYTSVVSAAIERLGAERVLFGSEYPLQAPEVELAKFKALGLPADQWRLIAWENTMRLIGETP
ncbi:amidohydrolase family protein [Streptomyces iconiensis]|uniref:Amidohydrolase family protein n=1 Tax=Streptomyces iconiensis TaxID=1384038 RepID=A0ABT6ZNC7_9ACTN|nr:amidohydrolase family protein [Streptomyces iconiensis]MDJ1130555.1 amidohydrolase family protein [Streptomyces iconiensis]